MSYTTMYVFRGKRGAETYRDFRNSRGSASYVWTQLAKLYFGWDHWISRSELELDRLWSIARDPDIPLRDRVAMAFTFDAALCAKDDLLPLADILDAFVAEYPPGDSACSLRDQATALRELAADKRVRAVGWNQTSVNGDVRWQPWDDKRDRPKRYNLDKETGHFFIDVRQASTPA